MAAFLEQENPLFNSDKINLPSKDAGQNKKASKWNYKLQRLGHGEEAGVERNFFTAINRGECRDMDC